MPNWKKVIVSGSNAVLNHITASGNVSGSAISTASFGTYIGDGSQLDGVSAFPFTGDAQISGSLIVSQSYTSGDTDSTALRLIGSGSVSQSGIFEVEGSAGPLFSVADGLDGVLMEVNNISGLPLFQVSSSNEVFVNRGNLTSGVTTATASFAHFTGSFQGDGSNLTGITVATPTLQQVVTAGASAEGDVSITGSLTISGSFSSFTLDSDNIVLGSGAGTSMQAGADNNVILGTNAGTSLTTGDKNVIIGNAAGAAVATDSEIIYIGNFAGESRTGAGNIAIGNYAAQSSAASSDVIAIGRTAARYTTGGGSIAIGRDALKNGNTDVYNIAIGFDTGEGSTLGPNIAIGAFALKTGGNGRHNTIIGHNAGEDIQGGYGNTMLGHYAGKDLQSGTGNIIIGSGSLGTDSPSNQLRIGNGNSIVTISGSLTTGDVIFYNTASAPNFSGSFQGDGSGLTGIDTGSAFPFTGDAQITGSLLISGSKIHLKGESASPGPILELESINGGSGKDIYVKVGDSNENYAYVFGADDTGNTFRISKGSYSSAAFGTNDKFIIDGNNIEFPAGNISGSITSTASFGTYIGDGSQLTNLPAASAGSTAGRVVFTTTNGELTSETGFTYDATTDRLTVPNLTTTTFTASFITSSTIETSGSNIFGDEAGVDVQTLIGTTKMTGSAQITGSLEILPAASRPPVKIYNSGTSTVVSFGDNSTRFQIPSSGKATMVGFNMYSGILAGTLDGGSQVINKLDRLELGGYGFGGTSVIGMVSPAGTVTVPGNGFAMYPDDANGAGTVSPHFKTEDGSILTLATTSSLKRVTADSSKISGSGGLSVESSGSTVFEVIGSEGTLFSIDDDLDGVIFTANDRSGLPVLEASASGEVYIGKAPQSLYTTAVISSTTAATTQSIFGLSTSSYGGAFFDYTVQSGSDARAGSIMSVWNGSNISFTETTTTDIGDTTDFNVIVHISESQAQIASHATRAGYNIKTIIRSI